MAEIRNYMMNFGFGRAPAARLTCAMRKLACAETHREPSLSKRSG
jgi:hypothetical protein